MTEALFAHPGDLATVSGGYVYDRRLIAELSGQGVRVEALSLGDAFPTSAPAALEAATCLLLEQPGTAPLIVDGLALGVLPEAAHAVAAKRPLVALVHHPLGLETGLAPDHAAALLASERRALDAAHAIVTTSATTAATLIEAFGTPPERITVAPPGVDRKPLAAPGMGTPPHLVTVATVIPRKGYDVLVAALTRVRSPWRLTIVGATDRDPACTAALIAQIEVAGLQDRILFTGALDAEPLAAVMASGDLFVMASHYEGYGMVIAEALAHGLPVVGTSGGALATTIPDGAGLKVPPNDPAALATAIEHVLSDPARLSAMAAEARRIAAFLPRWKDTAAAFARVIRSVG